MDISKIGGLIYVVRGQRVMLDADLAELYGVRTKQLSRSVKRNLDRFPSDFMLQLTFEEAENLRCQIGTSSWGGRRYHPRVFTEQGVAMLSSVLNSAHSVKVEKRLGTHEAALGDHAKAIRSVFDDIRRLLGPPDGPQKKIGFS